jgi:hypothetical protein
MFSLEQKREIASAVQKILRDTNHPELPTGEIQFELHVLGKEGWSYADIRNNGAVPNPTINPHNQAQDKRNTPTRIAVGPTHKEVL